jgi:hypothetical protein
MHGKTTIKKEENNKHANTVKLLHVMMGKCIRKDRNYGH